MLDLHSTTRDDLSTLAKGVVGSEILKIAGEVRALKAKGATVCNLTVGDFDPACFPIPSELMDGTRKALAEGHTNYPPSDGVLPLREAVVAFYKRELGLEYPVESVLITGGARPLLYGSYRTLVDPGESVIYTVPSWNNNHYAYLSGAKAVEIPVTAEANFFPTLEQLKPNLGAARMLVINSPLNPTGTAISREALKAITEAVVEENRRRRAEGRRVLFFVYDQVYWTLTFGATEHLTPVQLVPESAPYVIFIDALSKAFCATGMRVGWGVMPPAVRDRMSDILGHVGAWAPKAEQMATAALLLDPSTIQRFQKHLKAELRLRLDALFEGFEGLRKAGLPVEAVSPQGAIYLSVRFNAFGKTIKGRKIERNEDIRQLLLQEAGLAIVPFQAFGLKEENGWFRISVGACTLADIEGMFPRLKELFG
jgi:aspartate aminotransferase